MCVCSEILQSPEAEKELRFVRPDRPRLVLGNGQKVLFEVVFVSEGHKGKEVTLACDRCGNKWLATINGRYTIGKI